MKPHSVTLATDVGSMTILFVGTAVPVELLRDELDLVQVNALEVTVG
jgi:hypothetical protein